jgi:UDP-N-acetylglucosamine--N-acetylmuramyl-(pentapeptide) pyrophosphoryl-undecaprenol N-acetylglucosamine transferase
MKEACVHSLFPGAMQVLHFTGKPSVTEELKGLYAQRGIQAVVKDFEPRMDYAWRVASLALTRAGAGSIAEAMEFEVPAILIPYPHAADNHQQKNAEFFSYAVGGSLTYPDDRFSSTLLAKTLRDLLLDQQRGLQHMREAIAIYKKKLRKRDLCEVVEEFLRGL